MSRYEEECRNFSVGLLWVGELDFDKSLETGESMWDLCPS